MATVHSFTSRNSSIVAPTKRTAEQIKQIYGTIIPNTAEEVDGQDIDENGRYHPHRGKSGVGAAIVV